MKPDFEEMIPRLDRLIRAGKGAEVRETLTGIVNASVKIPAAHAADAARLAWRAALPDLGIRILNPRVRPTGKVPNDPTPKEKAEYAACLVKIGAVAESEQLLGDLDPAALPRVLLYQSFVQFARWDYQSAIPVLTRYLTTPNLTRYDRMVGKINLAAALIYEEHHRKAEYLVGEMLYETSLRRWKLALGKVFEMGAQNFVAQGKWAKAEEFLARAESTLAGTASLDLFFLRKLHAIARYLRSRGSAEATLGLRAIRSEAAELAHWETIRDCDRFIALGAKDAKLLQHVYFGTPFESFRDKLRGPLAALGPLPETYRWHLSEAAGKARELDLGTGALSTGGEPLKVGQAPHRLLKTLASDFYRPFRTPSLFDETYPGEFYNPVSAPLRVRQIVKRLRQWLSQNGFPLRIDESGGSYRLAADKPCVLVVPQAKQRLTKYDLTLERLRGALPDRPFSKQQACETLAMPARSVLRVLEQAIAEEKIEKLGKSNATRYVFRRNDRR